MKLTTKQAVDKLGNNSVVHEIGNTIKIIPCFKSLEAARPFLKHVGRFMAEKTKRLVLIRLWYNGADGWPKRLEYAWPPKMEE